jgi:16S rRNA (guanine527-N7)-methyltransferase
MATREFRDRVRRRAKKAGLVLEPALLDALETYLSHLARWNQKINLTALSLDAAPDEAIDRLLLEPILAARYLPAADARVMDVGSGGGSPAIPLKLAAPGIRLLMIESKVRKSAFLREVSRQLALLDTAVETARFEELLARPELHEAHDVITVRAVRIETRILMTLQAFLKPGGRLFLFRASGGADAPASIPPPLALEATHPLVDALGSRLQILVKVGPSSQG